MVERGAASPGSAGRGTQPRRAWGVPLALAAALLLSAWAAVQTGEAQEERVERVVADQPLDTHEDAADLFITATIVVFFVMAGGLLPGLAGKSARVLGALGTFALVGGGVWAGHSGGQLVYQHGAASAYAGSATQSEGAVDRARGADDDAR